jgi:PAS domain S-box-containing protein
MIEERYARLFNSIRDAILVADTDRRIIDCNRAFTELFGYGLGDISGRKTQVVYASEEEYRRLGEHLKDAGRADTFITVEYRCKDGRVFPGETTVFALQDDVGAVTGYIGMIRDVSERRSAQEELRREQRFVHAVLETSGALIVVLDSEGRVLRVNEACERVTGFTQQELTRRPLHALLPDDEQEEVQGVFAALLAGNYPSTHENHWITRDGEQRLIAWTNTITTDDEGGVENVIAAGIDITERIREEEDKVRRLQAEVSRLEQFASPASTRATGRSFAQRSFRERLPDDFETLCATYQEILKAGLEEKMYKTENRTRPRLQSLAQSLGLADAGPKDVVELHLEALRAVSTGVSEKRARALNEEARLAALELMGYLVSEYRNQVCDDDEAGE